jgi:hypothetical protein
MIASGDLMAANAGAACSLKESDSHAIMINETSYKHQSIILAGLGKAIARLSLSPLPL